MKNRSAYYQLSPLALAECLPRSVSAHCSLSPEIKFLTIVWQRSVHVSESILFSISLFIYLRKMADNNLSQKFFVSSNIFPLNFSFLFYLLPGSLCLTFDKISRRNLNVRRSNNAAMEIDRDRTGNFCL